MRPGCLAQSPRDWRCTGCDPDGIDMQAGSERRCGWIFRDAGIAQPLPHCGKSAEGACAESGPRLQSHSALLRTAASNLTNEPPAE